MLYIMAVLLGCGVSTSGIQDKRIKVTKIICCYYYGLNLFINYSFKKVLELKTVLNCTQSVSKASKWQDINFEMSIIRKI